MYESKSFLSTAVQRIFPIGKSPVLNFNPPLTPTPPPQFPRATHNGL
jgi:hypothetical protein